MYVFLRNNEINYKRPSSYAEYELAENFGFKRNDRSIIKPLEIDLISYDYNLGIEYDEMITHSYGHHRYSIFDNTNIDANYHLNKTQLMEEISNYSTYLKMNGWTP